MRLKEQKIIIVSLILVLLVSVTIFFVWNNNSDNKVLLDGVKLKNDENKNESIAIMIETENSDGTTSYVKSESNTWPTDMYFNNSMSGCIDGYGNKIENALSYDSTTNMINIEADSEAHCYIFFGFDSNLLSEEIIGLVGNGQVFDEGDAGYRYEGAAVDNYVDFNNETWRIIGVEEGSKIGLTSGEYYTKIIVSEAMINMPYESSGYHGGDWSTTSSYYLLNDYYYNRADGSGEMYCNISGTCDFSSIGLISDARNLIVSADMYYSQIDENGVTTSNGLYSQERSDSTKKVNAYVGIMYPSDYGYASLQSECANVSHYSYPDYCSSINWLNTGSYEWSISPDRSTAYSMYLFKESDMSHMMPTDNIYEVRPVVYLDSTVKITDGNGSSGSHYTISK